MPHPATIVREREEREARLRSRIAAARLHEISGHSGDWRTCLRAECFGRYVPPAPEVDLGDADDIARVIREEFRSQPTGPRIVIIAAVLGLAVLVALLAGGVL